VKDPARPRAAVFVAPGRPLEFREAAPPGTDGDDAVIAVTCATLCGSDLHTITGRRKVPGPTVLGHEIVGRVLAGGGRRDVDGTPLRPGDRVTWSLVVPCGHCRPCARGRLRHCERRFKYGHELFEKAPWSGGLAELCVLVEGTAVARVPDGLEDAVAATAGCAGATVSAALRAAGGVEGERVTVFGAGMLGLTAAAMAAASGAEVTVVDPDPVRRGRVPAFGGVGAEAAGSPADVVLEMSGAAAAIRAGLDGLAVGGRLVLVGSVFPGPEVPFDPEQIVRRRATIVGVHNYEPEDLRTAVAFLAATDAPFGDLIAPAEPLDRVDTAIAAGLDGHFLRVAVRP